MKHRAIAVAVVIATCALSLAACKSSSNGNGSGTDSPGDALSSSNAAVNGSATNDAPTGLASAKAIVAAASTEPADIPIKTPLARAPEKGIKVAFLTCSAAACSLLNPGFEAAAKALGWDPKVITYDSAQPGQALQQAIDAGYKYIATTSITLNTITPQVRQAQAKGIALFGAYTGDKPEGKSNGLYGVAQNFDASVKSGKLIAAWTIVDSSSNAHALYVDLPLYPTLVAQGKAAEAEYKADCASCSLDTLGLSVAQLGAGQGPSAIVTYLKSHPDINYVYLSFQDLDNGVAAALKSAGLSSKVKIVGTEGQTAQFKSMIAGTEIAWSVLPEPYVMWTVVDWMARLSEGALDQAALDATASGVQFMVDTSASASQQLQENGGEWPGPKNYQAQFKALWHVSA
jgi:ribose transport system substrate-binding protein